MLRLLDSAGVRFTPGLAAVGVVTLVVKMVEGVVFLFLLLIGTHDLYSEEHSRLVV